MAPPPDAWPGTTGELAGATFGRLTVEAPAPPDDEGNVRLLCRCACGRLAVRRVSDLREGRAAACRVCGPPASAEPRRRRPRRLRDPEGWEREKRAARDRRRQRREAEPTYREREAEYARRYRDRIRIPPLCELCGHPCVRPPGKTGPLRFCGAVCRALAKRRAKAA